MKATLTDDEARSDLQESKPALNVVAVFQDEPAREWAMQVCAKVNRLVGEDSVQSTWWEIHRLINPTLLADAVHAAVEADVVVVSLLAANELPPELCAWIDAWLPRRRSEAGALVALIGVQEGAGLQVFRAQDFLRAVALRGRLEYFPHFCRLAQDRKRRPITPVKPAPQSRFAPNPEAQREAPART